ncbi:hypothetical protein BpHYR1_014653 [Brachionus plicatilis]|uniref:Uncharacterized protein n=1 Tax=Brachionus plicatilis TaxID=10195 RepID=A0A3M7R1L9_BRAPC|nr:hypothetical protein BpHYR1_014653 [Brachionus plicatilis]
MNIIELFQKINNKKDLIFGLDVVIGVICRLNSEPASPQFIHLYFFGSLMVQLVWVCSPEQRRQVVMTESLAVETLIWSYVKFPWRNSNNRVSYFDFFVFCDRVMFVIFIYALLSWSSVSKSIETL